MINFRLALRSLLKTPLITAVAILSLALGIGANAAIFSIFEQLVLKSLPVASPQRLVNVLNPGPKSGSRSSTGAGGVDSVFSYPMFRDLERVQTPFTGIAAHCAFGANLAYAGDTLSSDAMLVSGNYFEVLGLQPAAGRLFRRDDDFTPGAHPVVVLGHAYWKTRFDSDLAVIGDSLTVNGHLLTIVGVAPRGFSGTTLGAEPRVYVPISLRGQMVPGWEGFDNRRSYWIYLFARLRPEMTLEQAQTALDVPYRGIIQEVELPLQSGASERFLERFKDKGIVLEPGLRGQSELHGEVRAPLLLLLGVTGFVLLIACANIANLLLVGATQRADEIAIRLAVGARRFQIVAQLLAESFLLAVLGGALGFLVAQWTLRLIASQLPADAGLALELSLGPAAWAVLAILTAVTALVGLFPALHSTRKDLVVLLKSQSGRSSTARGANRFRAVMVTLQIALSMALLVSAGLFTRSLVNVTRIDLGIETEHLASFGVSPDLNGYPPARSLALFERLEDELQALPGVEAVAASMVPLIGGSDWGSNVLVQGFAAEPDADSNSRFNKVGPGYFRALGIPLLAGREFERADALGAPKVAIVNETFARKFDLGRDAVDKRMQIGGSGDELDIEIVGLARDSKYSGVKQTAPPVFFLPYRQDQELGALYFYVRSAGEPESMLSTLRGAVARLDPDLPIEDLRTMTQQVREDVFLDRMLTTLSAAFAILATLLAAIGLYGVMAHSVAQRTREIGLRMALGADAGRVRGLILRQVGWLTLAGAAAGIAAGLGVGRVARSLLYELEGHDPGVFVLATAALAAVAVVAGILPAQRAASVDPMTALREE